MGKIVVAEDVTLDGVVEDNGVTEGFERGGWQFQCDPGAEGEAFKLQEMRDSAAPTAPSPRPDIPARGTAITSMGDGAYGGETRACKRFMLPSQRS